MNITSSPRRTSHLRSLPVRPKWQLLSRPLARNEFESLLLVRPPFFAADSGLGNSAAVIPAGSAFSVALTAPPTLWSRRGSFRETAVGANSTFVQRKQSTVNVLVSPPGPGRSHCAFS